MKIVLQLGSASTISYSDISEITLLKDLQRALFAFHPFTGCDSTSTFEGKEKRKCLTVLESGGKFLDEFSLFVEHQDVYETVGETLE